MSMGAQARVRWVEYADMLKGNTELLGGVYKPFNQKHLMSAWANLGAMSKVKKGVCRALSAAYLCRQYAKSRVPNLDDDEAALEELAKQDPKLLMSSLGKFFDVFREGRISDDEVKTLRNRGKVEREKRPEWQSGLAPKIDPFGFGFGVEQSGHLTIKEDDKWEQRAHKEWEPWRVRRVEQVAEAHYEAKKSRPKEFPKGDPLAPYHSDMDKTMAFFADANNFVRIRDGAIRLAGFREDGIWKEGSSPGYYMCWVSDHALALAVHPELGWGSEAKVHYKVKFFDPNYGECKFKTLEDFETFALQIADGFAGKYHQRHIDYRMYRVGT
jgi:hypothetical protein